MRAASWLVSFSVSLCLHGCAADGAPDDPDAVDAAAPDTGAQAADGGGPRADRDSSAGPAMTPEGGMSADAGDGGVDGGRPPRPRCTGRPGAPGTNIRMYRTPDDSSPRNVVVHVPSDLDPNEAVPILFAMHGATMSGEIMHEVADFDAIADRERFVVVYPSGTPGFAPWNVNTAGAQGGVCGTGALVSGDGNDVAFVEQMLADIADEQCIDRKAVFVTGFSMGGYFSNHIGCQTGDYLVRAIAPHSGGTYATVDCPGGHVPALILHGTNDGVIGANCGDDAASKWVQRNGCGSTFTTTPIEGGECRRYDGCPADGQVVHCVYEGMAHGWAGSPTGDQPGAETVGFYSGGTQYESASELIWSFFEEQLP